MKRFREGIVEYLTEKGEDRAFIMNSIDSMIEHIPPEMTKKLSDKAILARARAFSAGIVRSFDLVKKRGATLSQVHTVGIAVGILLGDMDSDGLSYDDMSDVAQNAMVHILKGSL